MLLYCKSYDDSLKGSQIPYIPVPFGGRLEIAVNEFYRGNLLSVDMYTKSGEVIHLALHESRFTVS